MTAFDFGLPAVWLGLGIAFALQGRAAFALGAGLVTGLLVGILLERLRHRRVGKKRSVKL